MALHSPSSGVFSLRNIALLSTGVVSFAVLLKLSVPLSDFAVELPSVYSAVVSWLRPPYLYLVINCIIISIVASSKLQRHHKSNHVTAAPSRSSYVFVRGTHEFVKEVGGEGSGEFYQEGLHLEAEIVEEKEVVVEEKAVVKEVGEYEERVVLSEKIKEDIVRNDSTEMLLKKVELKKENKPPASSRFGHKKSLKASTEVGKGAGLGVTRSKRHDTLESTWKMITDGRPMPLTRHLKKSDTWETHERFAPPPLPQNNLMKKSETFTETTKSKQSEQNKQQGSGRLKREPSLSQDELNKRVEAFIKKFNDEMRLQRQQSLNQYQEMIARGAS